MIDTALILLSNELESYINIVSPGPDVILENIALFESNQTVTLDGIVLTLVNLQEESTLKNVKAVKPNGIGGLDYVNPPVPLNLYLLISVNVDSYTDALMYLSAVIRFFQIQNTFTIDSAPAFNTPITGEEPEDLSQLRLSLDLYTLTFEQINHLWGSLGGRQLPFVLYKVRLVQVYDRRISKEGPPIEQIEATVNHLDENC